MAQKLMLKLLIAFLTSNAFSQTLLQRAESGEISFMAKEAPAMQAAFEKARFTLDAFLAAAEAPKEGTSGYALKVAVSDGKNTEYFWVNRFTNSKDVFSGYLGNEPRLVKKYRFGERFEFQRHQIADWTYIDTKVKRMHGNFTACALLTKETKADADAFKQRFGLECN